MRWMKLSLLGAGAAAWAVLHPRWVVECLLLLCSVFNPSVHVGGLGIYLNTTLVSLFIAAVFLLCIRGRARLLPLRRLELILCLFGGAALLSVALHGTGPSTRKRLLALAFFIFSTLAFARWFEVDEEHLGDTYGKIAWSVLIASLFGIYLYYGGVSFLGKVRRAMGAFGNPNGLANYLVIGFPAVLYRIASASSRRERVMWILASLAVVWAVLLTGSRGGGVAFFGTLGICLFALPRRYLYPLSTVLLLAAAGLMLYDAEGVLYAGRIAGYFTEFTDIFDEQKLNLWDREDVELLFEDVRWTRPSDYEALPRSLGARFVIWGQALQKIREHPFCGVGIGRLDLSSVPYDSRSFDNAFNIFLSAFCEMGLPGVLCLLWFYVELAFALRRAFSAVAEGGSGAFMRVCLCAAAFSNFFHGLVEDPLYLVLTNWLYGLVIGGVIVVESRRVRNGT